MELERAHSKEVLSNPPKKPRKGDRFKKDGKEYVVCGKGECELNESEEFDDWCRSTDCDSEDCDCWVMTAKKDDKDPTWEPWKKNKRGTKDFDVHLWYCCSCLKPIPG